MRRNIVTPTHPNIVASSSTSSQREIAPRRLFESPSRRSRFGRILNQWRNPDLILALAAITCLGINFYCFKDIIHSTINYDQTSDLHSQDLQADSSTPSSLLQIHSNNSVILSPLRAIDVEKYTIRINTWRRPEQLLVSVKHHSSCPGVAQIQIVWCDKEQEPPPEISNYDKVVIERHEQNSLNERFRILLPPPTRGILSIDDDVLRPCEAIDSGFFKWTANPDRMVGFDARVHVENENGEWAYGYMSTTEALNKYSMSLTRYCFIHQDYMHMYIHDLPKEIIDQVAENFNCEDIAMSFLISSKTHGKPSLLADGWALKTMIKLYVEKKISGSKGHKALRDKCVNKYAKLLKIKDDETNKLQMVEYLPRRGKRFFECGDSIGSSEEMSLPKSTRQVQLEKTVQEWKEFTNDQITNELRKLISVAGMDAYRQGLIEKTENWKKRFKA